MKRKNSIDNYKSNNQGIISRFHLIATMLLSIILFFSSCRNEQSLRTIVVNLNTVDDIKALDSLTIIPYEYRHIISLKDLSVKEKKQKFIELLLPSILIAKQNIAFKQDKFIHLMKQDSSELDDHDKNFLRELIKKYKAKSFTDLKSKLNTHPTSIVLAQSAIESGWGSSRFFIEANNIFGVWSFNKSDERIKASQSRDGKDIYLKKYTSISESIEDYFLTIARGPYKELRKLREVNNDPYEIIKELYRYSETGEEYINKLRLIIKKNKLTQFDNYIIAPEYLD